MEKWNCIEKEKELQNESKVKAPRPERWKLSAKMDSLRSFGALKLTNNSNTIIYILGSFEDLKMLRNELKWLEKCCFYR